MLTKVKKDTYNLYDKELLKSLTDNFITAVFDHNGLIIHYNDQFSRIFRISNACGQLQANQLLGSLENSKTVYDDICQAIQLAQKWKGILVHNKPNDKTYYLETSISPVKDENGTVIKYVAIGIAVSKDYFNEGTIKTVIKDGKIIFENSTKNVLFITKQGKIFNTSQRTATKKSLVGSTIYDFINPSNHHYLSQQMQRVFVEGKTGSYQSIVLTSKDGQALYVTKIEPVFNLENEISYATVKSEKYKNGLKVKKALKAIETKYANVFQSINAGIIAVANSQGNIIEWNKGAEKAFGYSASEIIGEHLTVVISKTHVDTGIEELRKAKDRLDKDLSNASIEMIGLKKSGEEFPVDLTMSHWEIGKERFYCAIMMDVSKRKNLEEKLRKTTKELELFLYRSAHDLKAPLTSAEGLLLLLKEEKINKKASVLVSMINDTLKKGRLLLDDLAFASIISEKSRETTAIVFDKQITSARSRLMEMKDYADINFKIDIQQETDFYFNQELMDWVFQNLIQNAVSFKKPKSSLTSSTVTITVKASEKEVNITVADDGLGIDKEHLDKVFDLYFRVSNETSYGTGLGLYILKRIVDVFQGHVSVTSELNQGTSFEVILPNLNKKTI